MLSKFLRHGAGWALCLLGAINASAEHQWTLKPGTPELQSAGQLAFAPDGILLVGDNRAAAIWALDTGEVDNTAGKAAAAPRAAQSALPPTLKIEDLTAVLARELKLEQPLAINDLAVSPVTGQVYLSVASGEKALPAIVRIGAAGLPELVELQNIPHLRASLPNPPEDKIVGEGRRAKNRRNEAITDLAYVDGKVLVAGMTSNPAPSQVLEFPFPFAPTEGGTTIEIYHAAHGKVEDHAAIRTFVPLTIDGEPTILAGFTCTPLVRLPIKGLEEGKKLRGTTVAELGNWNVPLDLISYEKDQRPCLLLANSARGVMKISLEDIGRAEGLSEHVRDGGTAGQSFEKIPALEGTVQLDKINNTHGVVIRKAGEQLNLEVVPLP
ncbi:MAG: hypothetical protein SFX18_04780 [Pirellulales bacterium]|nr:hypothetical protein [Pirellulales bacterium]